MRQVLFVALWQNQSGSVSALCHARAKDPLAMTSSSSNADKDGWSVVRSCTHTFGKEQCQQYLGVDPDTLPTAITKAQREAGEKQPTLEIHVDAEKALGMSLDIQTITALGVEEAVKFRILKRMDDGSVPYQDQNQKRDRNTKQPVWAFGEKVFRKTRLVPAGTADVTSERLQAMEAKPVVPSLNGDMAEEFNRSQDPTEGLFD